MGSLPHGGAIVRCMRVGTAHAVVVRTPSTRANHDPQFASGGHSVNSSLCHRIAGSSTTRIAKSTPPQRSLGPQRQWKTQSSLRVRPLRVLAPGRHCVKSASSRFPRTEDFNAKAPGRKGENLAPRTNRPLKVCEFPREARLLPSRSRESTRLLAQQELRAPGCAPQGTPPRRHIPPHEGGFEIGAEESAIPPSCSCP